MPIHDELGKRMKTFYEEIPKTKLMRRVPVAIRIDGKAFHTFTKGFQKPFDEVLIKSMQDTMKYLCENIQGCVLGYTQSDEITLILVDYKKLTSSAWIDYEVQKLCSNAASMATMALNKAFEKFPSVEGLIFHSDQGWQYQHAYYRNALQEHGIIQSMSRKGNCYDNCIMETFFGRLKNEMYYGYEKDYSSFEEFSKAVEEYIDYYNNRRIQAKTKWMPPVQYRIASMCSA